MGDDRRQVQKWATDAGRRYTDRNPHTVSGLNELRDEQYGRTQRELFEAFLDGVDRDSDILEVGTNVGVQLRLLREMGFENRYGFDVQEYAIEQGREYDPDASTFVASATDVPVRDGQFDLAFTVGVLVTMPPEILPDVLDEVVRCSSRYVLGLEFYADEYTRIDSDHEEQLYWKADFCELYRERHDLRLVDDEFLEYRENDNVDRMFLLEKRSAD